jgi:GAF domain-containing protein
MGGNKPRVALLGAREDEIELLAELHRHSQVELTAVYDPDPHAPGLAVAEIAGVPAGSDLEARQRLDQAEFVVLPSNRMAFHEAIDWCSGLHGDLIGLDEARRRWGGAGSAGSGSPLPAAARIEEMDDAGARLASRSELGEWFLDIAMRAVGASGGSLQLLAPETQELYLLAARGLSEDVVRNARHPLGEPISGLTAGMSTSQMLHGEQHSLSHGQRGALSSAMSVPLRTAQGTVIGVLNVSTTVRGKRFEASDLAQLEALGPHAARLLSRAHQFEFAAQRRDSQLFDTLRKLEEGGAELGASLRTLCNELRGRVDADSIVLYLTTEDGNWLQIAFDVGKSAQSAPARRSAAARACVERKWLHLVEYPSGEVFSREDVPREPEDLIDAAVERALAAIPDDAPSVSCVYAPLLGTTPVGVLAATFSSLRRADAFVRHGDATLRNIALYLETRLRERRTRRQLELSAHLSHALPNLLEARARGELEAVVVREAAQLASARRAILRHVDEQRRTYSRPVVHGVPEAVLDIWRKLDAQVTERTLERRSVEATTSLREENDDLNETADHRSLISVPVLQGGQLVAVLNVYDKVSQDPLEGRSFSEFDCGLLEDLARSAAPLFVSAAPEPAPGVEAGADDVGASQQGGALAKNAGAGRGRRSPLQTDSVRLRAELKREVARAQRHQRDLGVSLMHIKGLHELSEDSRHDLLVEVMRLVRLYTRRSDLVGWYGPDRLMVVSPESDPGGRELELRLRRLLRESAPPDAGAELVVRVGSSSYPDDGEDATVLLQTAASRLG